MPRNPTCDNDQNKMRVVYVRIGKTWKRVGWWCPQCNSFETEHPWMKFKEGRKGAFER